MHKFRATTFHAAVNCQAPVQPVVIFCQPLFLGKNQSWIDFSRHRNIMTIRYLPVVRVEDLPEAEQTATGLALAVRKSILNALTEMSATTQGQG
jgi:1-acyl-sn-glycerol-3-phosphate acyltransferase